MSGVTRHPRPASVRPPEDRRGTVLGDLLALLWLLATLAVVAAAYLGVWPS